MRLVDHTPSTLAPLGPEREVSLVGRLLAADEEGVTLADAFGSLRVEWRAPTPPPPPLSLVRVTGRWAPPHLVDAALLATTPCGGDVRETTRLLDGGLASRLAARQRILAELRAFFVDRGYLEVETRSVVPSPGLDTHLDAFVVEGAGYLVTSPEYDMKRLLAGGLPRIFQLARCFRQGEAGPRHNPEFTMLEWYRVGADLASLMDETEALVRHLWARHGGGATPLLAHPCDLSAPFLRCTVAEAFATHAGVDEDRMHHLAREDEDTFFRLLVEEVEPALARLGQPVFLYDYPAPQASLARLKPSDPRVAERVELYVSDLELSNGFAELTDPDEQRDRLERDQRDRAAAGKPVYPIDDDFLAALREGMPPCAGNALGLDRVIALCLGAREVAEVIAFPGPRDR
ncbi:MAG: EF-P lysine aminoacylase EpmA [Polyangiaceae bacterium]